MPAAACPAVALPVSAPSQLLADKRLTHLNNATNGHDTQHSE
jgi:hypothetical protein